MTTGEVSRPSLGLRFFTMSFPAFERQAWTPPLHRLMKWNPLAPSRRVHSEHHWEGHGACIFLVRKSSFKKGRCVILLRHLLSSCFKISVQLQITFNLSTNRWDFGGRCVTLLRRIFLTIHSKQLTMTHKEFYLFKRWVGETFWFGQNTVHESYCDDWSAWTRRTEQGHVLPFRHEAVGQEGSLSEYTACRKATKASSAVMTKTFGVSCLNSEEAQHFSLFLLNHDMRFADSGQRTKVQPCETRRTLRLGCRAPEMSLWRMFFLGISRRWGTSIKRRFQSRLSLCFCRKELVSPTTRSFRAYGQLYPIVILAGLEKGEMSDD